MRWEATFFWKKTHKATRSTPGLPSPIYITASGTPTASAPITTHQLEGTLKDPAADGQMASPFVLPMFTCGLNTPPAVASELTDSLDAFAVSVFVSVRISGAGVVEGSGVGVATMIASGVTTAGMISAEEEATAISEVASCERKVVSLVPLSKAKAREKEKDETYDAGDNGFRCGNNGFRRGDNDLRSGANFRSGHHGFGRGNGDGDLRRKSGGGNSRDTGVGGVGIGGGDSWEVDGRREFGRGLGRRVGD